MQYGNRSDNAFSFHNDNGLNRTMQYGNIEFSRLTQENKKFKSYYVVWKPRNERN